MSSYERRLYRSSDRILGGVCSGIAEYFGIDRSLVRIAWVALCMMWGSGVLIYLLAWLLIPPSPYTVSPSGNRDAAPPSQPASTSSNTGLIVVAILGTIILISGLANLAQGLLDIPFTAYVMPIALVIIGITVIAIAFMRRR